MRDLGRRSVFLSTIMALFVSGAVALAEEEQSFEDVQAWFHVVRRFDSEPEGRRPRIDPSFDEIFSELAPRIRSVETDSEEWRKLNTEFTVCWADSRFRTAGRTKDEEDIRKSFELDKAILEDFELAPEKEREIAERTGDRHVAFAKDTPEAKWLGHMESASSYYERAGTREKWKSVNVLIIDFKAKPWIEKYAAGEDFDAVHAWLKKHEEVLGDGEAYKCWRDLLETTGMLTLQPIGVEAEGDELFTVLGVVLRKKGGGKEIAWDGTPRRLKLGDYDLEVRDKATNASVMEGSATLASAGEALNPVPLPNRIPDNMVFVRAGNGPDGKPVPAFFIDRTEVSVAEYRAAGVPGSPLGARNEPARHVTFAEAKAYAREVGKDIPTLAQWMRAAYGSKATEFPWGGAPDADRCNAKSRAPMPAMPAGDASRFAHGPFNLYHLIGNVWEWVYYDDRDRKGWAVGGGWRTGIVNLGRRNAKLLRPGEEAYKALPLDDRKRGYKLWQLGFSKNYREEVGFRCVLELR